MSSRYYELQTEAAYGSRPSSPHRSRPQPQTSHNYARSSTSSDSSSSSASSSDQSPVRSSMDSSAQPRVVIMRCSRCAKCVETIAMARDSNDLRKVTADDASAAGMVRFGHNLFYCDRCAKMVGYQ